jgi:type IV pilus assembly protein PilX
MINRPNSKLKQQGVTLVFSLVMLVALTLIGVTSMQSSMTELTMAGNQRESDLMFQVAETGTIAAENFIQTSISNSDFSDASRGLYTMSANYSQPDYFDASQWDSSAQSSQLTSFNYGLQSRYKVEYLGDRKQNPFDAGIPGYDDLPPGETVSIYRTTSRGIGLTGNNFRYIQSYFGKEVL